MKIVLWIGNKANQRALANKIHATFPVAGIVTETRRPKSEIGAINIIEKGLEKVLMPSIGNAWNGMKKYYDHEFPVYPETRILDVENINSDAVFNFTKELVPDLIIVSGTRMIKDRLLSISPRVGILNLHTGLSPYIKGGPNSTNWCLATNQFHLIGNTIMWIDKGIDTGDILTSELTDLDGTEDLLNIHIKVMEHAHRLYIKAIDHLLKGRYSRVKQSVIAKGTTYFTRQWKTKEKIQLALNLRKFRKMAKNGYLDKMKKDVTVVKL